MGCVEYMSVLIQATWVCIVLKKTLIVLNFFAAYYTNDSHRTRVRRKLRVLVLAGCRAFMYDDDEEIVLFHINLIHKDYNLQDSASLLMFCFLRQFIIFPWSHPTQAKCVCGNLVNSCNLFNWPCFLFVGLRVCIKITLYWWWCECEFCFSPYYPTRTDFLFQTLSLSSLSWEKPCRLMRLCMCVCVVDTQVVNEY